MCWELIQTTRFLGGVGGWGVGSGGTSTVLGCIRYDKLHQLLFSFGKIEQGPQAGIELAVLYKQGHVHWGSETL